MAAGQSVPTVSVTYPRGFAPLPIGASVDARSQQAIALVDSIQDPQKIDRAELISHLTTVAKAMVESGVQQAGVLTLPDCPPTTSATVLLSIAPFSTGTTPVPSSTAPLEAAESIAAVIRERQPQSILRVQQLPAGTAVVFDRVERFNIAAEHTPENQDRTVESRSVQYLLPTPDSSALLVLNISSSAAEQWPHFLTLANQIAESIRFGNATAGAG